MYTSLYNGILMLLKQEGHALKPKKSLVIGYYFN